MRQKSTIKSSISKVDTNYKRFNVERLAERVFVSFPRAISFSHRNVSSLRHPFLPLALECIRTKRSASKSVVNEILEALLESNNEAPKWERVSQMFDSQMHNEDLDKKRSELMVSGEITSKIESLWSIALAGSVNELLFEEDYKYFHQYLYSYVLDASDLSLIPATIGPIMEDFEFDCRGREGVTFEAFAVSMLEFADNWTNSRNVRDYALFLEGIVNRVSPLNDRKNPPVQRSFIVPENAFFSGGLLAKRSVNGCEEYYKCVV